MELQAQTDSLRLYLTGAVSDGGSQSDPASSTGGYRSGSELHGCGIERAGGGVAGLLIDYLSPALLAAGATVATVTTDDDNALQFSGGGSYGDAVTLGADGSGVIADGDYPNRFARVSRSGSLDISGSEAVTPVERRHNLFDEVSYPQHHQGLTDYRCVAIKNVSDLPIADVAIYLDSGHDDSVAIGLQLPSVQPDGSFATVATVAAVVTFVQPDSSSHADVLNADGLMPGEIIGLWLRRTITAATDPSPRKQIAVAINYTYVY